MRSETVQLALLFSLELSSKRRRPFWIRAFIPVSFSIIISSHHTEFLSVKISAGYEAACNVAVAHMSNIAEKMEWTDAAWNVNAIWIWTRTRVKLAQRKRSTHGQKKLTTSWYLTGSMLVSGF